jgi:ElaB/YqjD/DUF883 family membrane-anchored ribosome-binding protein
MVQSKSPAVVALEQERASQQAQDFDSLEAGLEATFPSDPASSTITSIPTGNVVPASADQDAGTDAPLVDAALASVREHEDSASSVLPDEEMAALRVDLKRLRENVAELGPASVRLLRARREDVLDDARARIRNQPLKAVGFAMLAGFLLGTVR